MKILFLGGTGNISAECAALPHERGHEILVLSRGRNVVPPEVVINFLGCDLPDVQTDFDLFHGVVRQYVFISSTVIYAKPPPRLPLAEDAPVGNPWWDYAQKKLACEQWLRQRQQESGALSPARRDGARVSGTCGFAGFAAARWGQRALPGMHLGYTPLWRREKPAERVSGASFGTAVSSGRPAGRPRRRGRRENGPAAPLQRRFLARQFPQAATISGPSLSI